MVFPILGMNKTYHTMPRKKYTLFSQVLGIIDRNSFDQLVDQYDTDKHAKGLDSWTHLVSMLFMQFAHIDTLRDICNGLRSATGNLNHFGIDSAPSKSGLSYRNKHRTFELFRDFYFALLELLEPSLHERKKHASQLKQEVFIMDSSIIPLSLSLFDWAKFRTRKGAIKLHAVLNYGSTLPQYAVVGEGSEHDVKKAKGISFPCGSVLVADRAYVDFEWLNHLDSKQISFVTRLKSNADFRTVTSYRPVDGQEHILCDQDIDMMGPGTSEKYPDKLRIVRVYDKENENVLTLLTNNFNWTAETISQLYKARWSIEVFFKYLKQLFRVKSFVGTSANAVRIQMWCALMSILLFKYLKNKAEYPWHLSNLVNFLRMNLFNKINVWEWADNPFQKHNKPPPQLALFSP